MPFVTAHIFVVAQYLSASLQKLTVVHVAAAVVTFPSPSTMSVPHLQALLFWTKPVVPLHGPGSAHVPSVAHIWPGVHVSLTALSASKQ
jgi:hypothetical protein